MADLHLWDFVEDGPSYLSFMAMGKGCAPTYCEAAIVFDGEHRIHLYVEPFPASPDFPELVVAEFLAEKLGYVPLADGSFVRSFGPPS